MSESEFVVALRKEHEDLSRVVKATEAELPAALETRRIAREEYQSVIERTSRLISGGATSQDHELNEAATEANQAVAALERSQERGLERIKEIDRLLTAAGDATRARKELAKANASIAEARGRISQLDQIISALEGEIEELKQKRLSTVELQGRAELDARLAGKSVSPSKGLAALDADLESRNAALTAARTASAEVEGPLVPLIEESDGARNRLRGALIRRAELDYYEALPAFLPIIAKLRACGSYVGGGFGSTFEIDVDHESVQAAAAAFDAELNETSNT